MLAPRATTAAAAVPDGVRKLRRQHEQGGTKMPTGEKRPYKMVNAREIWTEDEHKRFLEALQH